MNNQIIYFFLTYSLIFTSLCSNPNINELKNTVTILNETFQYLSPACGALWAESPIIENIYRYGNGDIDEKHPAVTNKKDSVNAIVELVKQLFYLNNDNVNFTIQTNPDLSVTSYLTPRVIGKIIGACIDPMQKPDQRVDIISTIMNNPEQTNKIKVTETASKV